MAKTMKPWVEAFDEIETHAVAGPIDCRGYNAIAVHAQLDATKNWTFSILGSMSQDGPFLPVLVDGTELKKQTNASGLLIFQGLPDYVQLKAYEDEDGAKLTASYSVCLV